MDPNAIKDLGTVVAFVQAVGPLGLLVFIYWKDQQTIRRNQEEAEKRFQAVKDMYEANIILVKNYEKVAESLVDTVRLNTQHMTIVEKMIEDNQYCPEVRRK